MSEYVDSHEWMAFFACIEHKYFDEIVTIVQEYDTQGYIIAKEVSKTSHKDTNGEHIHFVVQMPPSDYKRLADRVFIKRFHLRGRASKGLSRQYGKVNNIENLERMKAYSIKDDNYETNLDHEEIARLTEISFQKNEDRALSKEILDNMLEHKADMLDSLQKEYEYLKPEAYVINYFRVNKISKRINKRLVDGIVTDFYMDPSNQKYIKDSDILTHLGYR